MFSVPRWKPLKSRPRSLKNGACISIDFLRVVHRLLSRPPRARIDSPSPAAVFLQPFKSNFIPDPEGTISFALSPLLRDLFDRVLVPQRTIYRLYPAGSIKGIGLTGQHLRCLGFHIENGACGPRNTSHGRLQRRKRIRVCLSNTSPRRVVDHAHSRVDRHAPGKNYIELLAVLVDRSRPRRITL